MKSWKRGVLAVSMVAIAALTNAQAQQPPMKIGFITDMSGVYADLDGPGGAEAVRMAIEDAGGAVNGRKIELLVADHQNKADIAAAKAREWYDSGVDVIVAGTNSSTVLAINHIAKQKKKILLSPSSSSMKLTNEDCTPYTVQWVTDSTATARVAGDAMVQQGGKNWFLITVDVAFGHSLERDIVEAVKAQGGTISGSVRHPLGTTDFSSLLLQAKASGAQVLGLATGGGDLIAAIKGANEFGLNKTMKVAAPLTFLTDIHALGLDIAQGLIYTEGWYWDLNDQSRQWAKRFFERRKVMPTMFHAGNASVLTHYLNAVKAVGDNPEKVMAKMRSTPVNDFFAKNGVLRPDGRMVHDMYLMQVKSPKESSYPWDYAKLISTVAGDKAFLTRAESKCTYWTQSK